MTQPELSVVVASVNGFPYLGECLEALDRWCPDADVVVADSTEEATRARVEREWPRVRLLSFDEQKTIPELRAAGIAAARADCVAVLEDHCIVGEGWAERILRAQREGRRVVGGAIRNAARERTRDWAAYFCEYSAFMDPARAGPVHALPGMNVAYHRTAIAAMQPLLDAGRWETWLHPHLERSGFELYSDPELVVDHAKDFDLREFLSQRYHYSRSYAGMRNGELGWKRIVYLAGSPAIVPLAYARIARNVLGRRRHRRRFAEATPLILLYTAVWAFGEAVGYAAGGGRSLLKVR